MAFNTTRKESGAVKSAALCKNRGRNNNAVPLSVPWLPFCNSGIPVKCMGSFIKLVDIVVHVCVPLSQ
jgi:hypothetical protein